MRRTGPALLVLVVGAAACQGASQHSDAAVDQGSADLRVDGPAEVRDAASPCGQCPEGYTCLLESCVLRQGPCTIDEDCQADTFCAAGACQPYGRATKLADPSCTIGVTPFEADELAQPEVRCSWSDGPVMMTPVVADLDHDGLSEIIVTNFENGHLVVLDGRTCAVKVTAPALLEPGAQLAVADLEGDGTPEIVGIKPDDRVVIMSASGSALAMSEEPAKLTFDGPVRYDGGAAIANLDAQGVAEIVYAGMALRFEQGKLVTLFNVQVPSAAWGVLSAVADVDLDGKPEVVVGSTILDGLTGADKTPAAVRAWPAGYPAVADFDPSTPEPEIVLHSSQSNTRGEELRIYHPVTGALIGALLTVSPGRWGGPPTVADLDGDGRPEVGVAGPSKYTVFDPGPGVLWKKESLDQSSGSTGSSVFDFNGDGRAEVIYHDECWLRVYDGQTGQTRFAYSASSLTLLDSPVIADLDHDGHADLLVTSTNYVPCDDDKELGLEAGPQTKGVFVLQDPKNRWMPSRGVWNQHTYHVTNINDDLTVPQKETPSWTGANSYRQNVQGEGAPGIIPGPDLTGGWARDPGRVLPDCAKRWPLRARICNRGAARVVGGVLGTFFLGDPQRGGKPICTAHMASEILPGKCALVGCDYESPPAGEIDLWFVVDRSASGESAVAECKEENNTLHLPRSACYGLE